MNNTKDTYLEQIKKYYNRKLSSHELISLGTTPEIMRKFGAPDLPLVMQQRTLTKCIRKPTGSRSAHELTRNIIETLPEQINNPIFLVQDRERNSIALISDAKDKAGHSILIAIRMNEKQKAMQVNEIKSIYGKTNLKEYLYKHIDLKQLNVIDNEKAGMLSRVLGLQLPTALTASSHNQTIASESRKVNHDFRSDRAISIQKDSVLEKLNKFEQSINKGKENTHPVKANNLEHQRDSKER